MLTSKRLDEIPGVGPMLATAQVASVADPRAFRSGRSFSVWVGLVPKQHSSGGKDRLGSISKQGDRYLRRPGESVRKYLLIGGQPQLARPYGDIDASLSRKLASFRNFDFGFGGSVIV